MEGKTKETGFLESKVFKKIQKALISFVSVQHDKQKAFDSCDTFDLFGLKNHFCRQF